MTLALTRKEKHMPVTVAMLPVTLNDGTRLSREERKQMLRPIWAAFGGLSVEGYCRGHWVNDAGKHFEDTCLKVRVAVPESRLEEYKALLKDLGARLNQECMYLEVLPHEAEFLEP